MDYPEIPNLNHKRSILALLIRLRNADEEIAQKENSYMISVCDAIGLAHTDIELIESNIDDYPLYPPKQEADRMAILYYLLFQLKIDGEVSESEIKLIQEFGFKLGFHELLTKDMVIVIQDHIKKNVPPEKMLEIIRKYSN